MEEQLAAMGRVAMETPVVKQQMEDLKVSVQCCCVVLFLKIFSRFEIVLTTVSSINDFITSIVSACT